MIRLIMITAALGFVIYRGIQDRKANRKTWQSVLLPYALFCVAVLLTGFIASVIFGVTR